MQIGEMLVRAKAFSPADLEEAVSWQVLYGGRLGTNLLELGLVDERLLAESLGKQMGCEWTSGEMELPASMVQTIPSVVARRHEIVPWKVEGKKFKVLAIAPRENLAMLDEMGFRLGKIVKPVVAPEFRIHQLLRRYFGSVRQMRALDFGVKPKGKRAQEAERKAENEALEKAADLMDDDAFAAIYNQVMEDRSANAGPAPQSTPMARIAMVSVPAALAPTPGKPGIPSGWTAAPPPPVVPGPPVMKPAAPVAAPAPRPAPPPPPAPAPPPPEPVYADAEALLTPSDEDELPLLEAELVEDTAPVETEEDGLRQDQWAAAFSDLEKSIEESEPPPAPPAELTPLTFKEAVAAIAASEGRDGVARSVLRYARSNAARAILVQVQGDVALGWDAIGEDLTPDLAKRIAFPLTAPGAFRLVRESRSHYIGPLGKEAGNVRFLKLAGKKWPGSAVLLPILFRGKVVYILYVDNGHKQQVNPDVGELLILSQNITRSMEQMVAKRQAARK